MHGKIWDFLLLQQLSSAGEQNWPLDVCVSAYVLQQIPQNEEFPSFFSFWTRIFFFLFHIWPFAFLLSLVNCPFPLCLVESTGNLLGFLKYLLTNKLFIQSFEQCPFFDQYWFFAQLISFTFEGVKIIFTKSASWAPGSHHNLVFWPFALLGYSCWTTVAIIY